MNPRLPLRLAATAVAASLALAACGGDDDDAPAADAVVPTVAPDTGPVDEPSGAIAPPDATIAPDIPEEYLEAVGPVEVDGASLALLGAGSDDAIGTPAPTIVGLDYDGNPVRIDAATDGPTMVVFLAHWCPHCNSEIPRLNELRDAGDFPDALNIVAVSTAVNPGQPNFPPDEWIVERDWTYPVIADGVDLEREHFIAADAFGVGGFPFTVLIDGDGVVADRWSGEREPDEILGAISSALGL